MSSSVRDPRAPAGATTRQGTPAERNGRGGTLAAAALLAAALVIPPAWAARALASATVPANALLPGFWIFKVLLAFHALLLFAWARRPASPEDAAAAAGASRSVAPIGWWILAGLLALGALARLAALDAGLWHDEIATYVLYVRRPVSEIISLYDSQNQHPLYSLLARATVRLLGDGEGALRLPAALAGVGSLAATFWFARMLVPWNEALLATALLTASYHHVWFSQNARGYTLLLLLTIVGTGLFVRLLQQAPRWKDAIAYGVVMALAVYTHLSAGFVVGAHALVWAFVAGRRRVTGEPGVDPRPAVALLLATTLSLQLYAVVMPQLLHTLFEKNAGAPATEWRSPLWLLAETARGLSRGLPGGWVGLAGGCLVAAAGTWSYARKTPTALALMLLPPTAVAFIMLALQHNLWPRLFFFAAAFAVLIVVRGVFAGAELASRKHGARFATAALALAVAGSASTVPRAWGPKQDFRGAIAYVERERAPEDAVVAVGLSDLALVDFLKTGWARPRTIAELRAIEAAHPRTWAVYTFPTHLSSRYPDIEQRLRDYAPAAQFRGTVGDGTVYVLVR